METVKFNYFAETDSLYIDLSDAPSVDSREVAEDVVLDYDASGSVVGIDIDHASQKVERYRALLTQMAEEIARGR
jgi:uncharacterized protein YuzE